MAVPALPVSLPPSSPPTTNLLTTNVMIQRHAQITNTATLNPSDPAGT